MGFTEKPAAVMAARRASRWRRAVGVTPSVAQARARGSKASKPVGISTGTPVRSASARSTAAARLWLEPVAGSAT